MLTFCTTAKPFEGHSGIIQRNALKSWVLLGPKIEVILFGDELGLRHEPHVERNKFGTKRLDYMFCRAQEIARHDIVCYINCDIILPQSFCAALQQVGARHDKFLMVGRRWDADIKHLLDFSSPKWEPATLDFARTHGVQRTGDAVDYFAFRRGLYAAIPPLVVGRIWWDHWLVWRACKIGAAVVDVSDTVTAVHQNHNYGYHPVGASGVWADEQARENYSLAGGKWHLYTIDDATHVLDSQGEHSNRARYFVPYWRFLRPTVIPVWHAFLNVTRPIRHFFGLRQNA
jgi:hypothetical protein